MNSCKMNNVNKIMKNSKHQLNKYRATLNGQRLFATQEKVKEINQPTKIQEEWNNAIEFEKMPGPSKFQLVRAFLPGGKHYGQDRRVMFQKCREEYGDIFRLPSVFGQPGMIATFSADQFEKVFRHEGIWPGRRALETMEYYRKVHNREIFKECGSLLTTNGEEWGKFRSIVNPILMQPKTIGIYVPRMEEVGNDLVARIKKIKDPKTNEVPDNFERELNNFAMESVALVGLDTRLGLIGNIEDPTMTKMIESLDKIFNLPVDLEFKPSIWKLYKTRKFKELMEAFDNLTQISQKYIDQAIKRIENNPDQNGNSVLERILKINKNVAIVMALEMLFAGVDTTSSALTGCLLSLSKNQNKQDKLREEIIKIFPEKNSEITNEKLKSMPYLRAVIKESLRYHPVVNEQSRQAGDNLVLGGYKIPKGSDVMMMSNELYRDEKYFPEPNKFLPERWLRNKSGFENGCPMDIKTTHPFTYIPFGFGSRMCIGKRLVDLEMEVALSKIIRNFRVEYDYDDNDVFKLELIYTPNKVLKFKFTDIEE